MKSGGGGASGADGLLTEINVTPLVDVVLVLLILMMVTATTLASKTIPVDLPKASTGSSAKDAKEPFTLAIDADGAMFVKEERVDDAAVRARARGAEGAVLAADGRARHETVVHALELLRAERVAKIAIVVRDAR
ncbi:MAG: biopolymer transporter ExbD [Labilithrix sp.]|nr:biopolymer transporter ExbD [Labilithrix sp.]MCW5810104.1 biopolymer transporter ExbD [Labilithrix sp.]